MHFGVGAISVLQLPCFYSDCEGLFELLNEEGILPINRPPIAKHRSRPSLQLKIRKAKYIKQEHLGSRRLTPVAYRN